MQTYSLHLILHQSSLLTHPTLSKQHEVSIFSLHQYQLMILNFTTLQAHVSSELTSLALHSNKLITTGNDSCVKIWDLRSLQLELCVKLPQSYLTALLPYGNQVLVGNGDGQIMALDSNTLQVTHTSKLHTDCINDIKIFEDKIVTASSDGSMALLDPAFKTNPIKVELGSPLRQVQRFKSSYFLGGCKSFEVQEDLSVKQASNIWRYLPAFGGLYGTNDEKGFMGISRKFNTYVPCENMMEFGTGILGVSWSTLSFFTTYPDDDRISFSSTRLGQVLEGDSILSMTAVGKRVFAGSQCGNLYSFTVNTDYHWYDE